MIHLLLAAAVATLVNVAPGVKDEVLDWGGTGSPIVFLPGLGNDAHVFDAFAAKFTAHHHVYGITPRGFGHSSKPAPTEANYSADRLADDVLAVLDAEKIDRPVLIGHSISGEILSSIGTRHPHRVAGLVYLEAGYPYAYYDPTATITVKAMEDSRLLRERLAAMNAGAPNQDALADEAGADLARLRDDLRLMRMLGELLPPPPANMPKEDLTLLEAFLLGNQVFTAHIDTPILAFYAYPTGLAALLKGPAAKIAAATAALDAGVKTQIVGFSRTNPQATIVEIPRANHYIFISNEAEVERAIDQFLEKNLPK
jgi:non-heme chloroperoxidase